MQTTPTVHKHLSAFIRTNTFCHFGEKHTVIPIFILQVKHILLLHKRKYTVTMYKIINFGFQHPDNIIQIIKTKCKNFYYQLNKLN